jgi:single-strand DNA-binding protein
MYQKTVVIGHLGRDPEMRYTPSGVPVTSFSVATPRSISRKAAWSWWKVMSMRRPGPIKRGARAQAWS